MTENQSIPLAIDTLQGLVILKHRFQGGQAIGERFIFGEVFEAEKSSGYGWHQPSLPSRG